MTEEDELIGRDQYCTYRLRNGWSLRRAGLKGWWVDAKIVGEDVPALILTGTRKGRLEIPLTDICRIRAGVEAGKIGAAHIYRCLLWRDGERKLVLLPTSFGRLIYGNFILHLGEEMKRMGIFDRVERGLRGWETGLYSLLMVVAAVFLSYGVYDTLHFLRRPIETKDMIFAGIMLSFCALLLYGSVAIWNDAGRPRRVRSLKDLKQVLP